MDTKAILAAVKQEIGRLQKVADLLEPSNPLTPVSAVTKTPAKKGHRWTAAQRKAMSAKLKASWAKRQKKSK